MTLDGKELLGDIAKHSVPGAVIGGVFGAILSFGKNAVLDGDFNNLLAVDWTLPVFATLGALFVGGFTGFRGVQKERFALYNDNSGMRVPRDDGPGGSD